MQVETPDGLGKIRGEGGNSREGREMSGGGWGVRVEVMEGSRK